MARRTLWLLLCTVLAAWPTAGAASVILDGTATFHSIHWIAGSSQAVFLSHRVDGVDATTTAEVDLALFRPLGLATRDGASFFTAGRADGSGHGPFHLYEFDALGNVLDTVELPSALGGLTFVGNDLWGMHASTFYRVDTVTGALDAVFTAPQTLRGDIAWNGSELIATNHDPALCPAFQATCSGLIHQYDLTGTLLGTSPNPLMQWGGLTHDDELLLMSSNLQWAGGSREVWAHDLVADLTIFVDGLPAPLATAPNITGLTHVLPAPGAGLLVGLGLAAAAFARKSRTT